jgi:ribosomal protein S18 acetylase RimI-like enzyme
MSIATPVVRTLSVDDTDAVVDLATLCEIAETGEPDAELVDWIRAGAARDGFHLFGIDADDGLAAFSLADCQPGLAAVEVEVRVRPGLPLDRGLPLLAAARRAARAFDPAKPVHLFANSEADAYRRWLHAQGATEIRHFWRMAIDLDETGPPLPPAPAGLTVRTATDTEPEMRRIFSIVDASFEDHFGHTDERTYEVWIDNWQARAGFDLGLWWVAELDEEPVAALLAVTFDSDAGAHGHIGTLGTLKHARGRGIGSFLLRTAFAEFHRRGYRKVTLGVDSENVTNAVRLYESVGMHVTNDHPLYELPPLT